MNTLGNSGKGTGVKSGVSARLLSLMLLLALAVVMWGLHDKLSLYKHTGSAPPVAKAKLLSGRDNAQALQAVSAVSPEPRLLLPSLLFAALLALLLPSQRAVSDLAPRTLERQFWRAALYRRPPPFLVFANV